MRTLLLDMVTAQVTVTLELGHDATNADEYDKLDGKLLFQNADQPVLGLPNASGSQALIKNVSLYLNWMILKGNIND